MGKMEKLTNSIKNQTRKEVKGMKKVLISLALAMVLVMAMAVPVMAAASEESETASVTVVAYISSTITDAGAAGMNFGSLNPGTSDNPELAQNGAGAINISVGAETNLVCKIGTKGTKDFEIVVTTGTATNVAPSATVLTASGDTFTTDGVAVGDTVYNETDGSSGTVLTVDSETQLTLSAALIGGTANTFTSGDTYRVVDDSFALGSAKWDLDSTVIAAIAMTTSYAQIGTDTTPGAARSQEVWHWISVPNGQKAGAYSTTFYYKADQTL